MRIILALSLSLLLPPDPHASNNTFTNAVLGNLHESLVRMNDRIEIEPSRAISRKRTPPTIWPIQLRPGATFHTDAPILADDVAVTWAARNGIAPHQAPDNQLRLRQVTTL